MTFDCSMQINVRIFQEHYAGGAYTSGNAPAPTRHTFFVQIVGQPDAIDIRAHLRSVSKVEWVNLHTETPPRIETSFSDYGLPLYEQEIVREITGLAAKHLRTKSAQEACEALRQELEPFTRGTIR